MIPCVPSQYPHPPKMIPGAFGLLPAFLQRGCLHEFTAELDMSEISKQSDAELFSVIEQSKDASMRGAVRLELETRTLRRRRIAADWQTRVAWAALLLASASSIAAVEAVVVTWMHR